MTTYVEPNATRRYEILGDLHSVALVGASSNPARASYFVASYLMQDTDYDLYFVNPRASEILGRPAYPTLADLPVLPDAVVAFRKPEDLPEVARQAVAIGAKVLWIQLGLVSEEAASIALDAGLDVVMDRCIKIEHARFHGGLHLGGFNTGVISSRIASAPGRRRVTSTPTGKPAAASSKTDGGGFIHLDPHLAQGPATVCVIAPTQ